jgi:hypothetical protein
VAQVINKNPDIDNGQFTEKDEKVTHHVSQMKCESVASHSKRLLDECWGYHSGE